VSASWNSDRKRGSSSCSTISERSKSHEPQFVMEEMAWQDSQYLSCWWTSSLGHRLPPRSSFCYRWPLWQVLQFYSGPGSASHSLSHSFPLSLSLSLSLSFFLSLAFIWLYCSYHKYCTHHPTPARFIYSKCIRLNCNQLSRFNCASQLLSADGLNRFWSSIYLNWFEIISGFSIVSSILLISTSLKFQLPIDSLTDMVLIHADVSIKRSLDSDEFLSVNQKIINDSHQ